MRSVERNRASVGMDASRTVAAKSRSETTGISMPNDEASRDVSCTRTFVITSRAIRDGTVMKAAVYEDCDRKSVNVRVVCGGTIASGGGDWPVQHGVAAPPIAATSSPAFVIKISVSNRAAFGPGPDAATGKRMRSHSSFDWFRYRYALAKTAALVPGTLTVTSTVPVACGGAIATISRSVFERTRANASPNFTEAGHGAGPEQPRGLYNPVPHMCTKSPPVVTPDAGRIAVTVVCAKRTGAARRKRQKPRDFFMGSPGTLTYECACTGSPGACVCPACPDSTCCTTVSANFRNACAAADEGSRTKIGSPLSPPTTTFGSIGISPRNGTPRSSAVLRPPPWPKISSRSPQWRQMK